MPEVLVSAVREETQSWTNRKGRNKTLFMDNLTVEKITRKTTKKTAILNSKFTKVLNTITIYKN